MRVSAMTIAQWTPPAFPPEVRASLLALGADARLVEQDWHYYIQIQHTVASSNEEVIKSTFKWIVDRHLGAQASSANHQVAADAAEAARNAA